MAYPHFSRCIAILTGCLVLLAGCQNQRSSRGPDGPEQVAAIRNALIRALKLGMRDSQVQSWLGDPKVVQPAPSDPTMEEWIYENDLPTQYRTVAIETEEVPWVDPISGELRMIEQPLVGQQRVDGREILTLTFQDGRLKKIDRTLDERPSYSR